MYNLQLDINNENIIELLEISEMWKLKILRKLCIEHLKAERRIDNVCTLYNGVIDVIDSDCNFLEEFIREHIEVLHTSGQLYKLTIQNLLTIIKHDQINVETEDIRLGIVM